MFAVLVFSTLIFSVLSIPSPETGNEVCNEYKQQILDQCLATLSEKVKANKDVMEKYKEDKNPDNIPEDVKKDVCCLTWKGVDCAKDVFKEAGKPECNEKLEEKIQGKFKAESDKICGDKYSKSSCESQS